MFCLRCRASLTSRRCRGSRLCSLIWHDAQSNIPPVQSQHLYNLSSIPQSSQKIFPSSSWQSSCLKSSSRYWLRWGNQVCKGSTYEHLAYCVQTAGKKSHTFVGRSPFEEAAALSSNAASKVVEGGVAACENCSVSLPGGNNMASPVLCIVCPPIRPCEPT